MTDSRLSRLPPGPRSGLSREVLQDRAAAAVLDAAFAVFEALGPGHDAKTYEGALVVELRARSLGALRAPTFSVLYRGEVVGSFTGDLLVEGRVLVVVRSDPRLDDAARDTLLRGIAKGDVKVGVALHFADELRFSRVL